MIVQQWLAVQGWRQLILANINKRERTRAASDTVQYMLIRSIGANPAQNGAGLMYSAPYTPKRPLVVSRTMFGLALVSHSMKGACSAVASSSHGQPTSETRQLLSRNAPPASAAFLCRHLTVPVDDLFEGRCFCNYIVRRNENTEVKNDG